MDACHLLLGRPWQFDREVLHDGKKNTYTFKIEKKTITLAPLKPSQIHQPIPKPENHKGNLFLSGTKVEQAIVKNQPVLALLITERRNLEPIKEPHPLIQPLLHEYHL